MAEAAHYNLGRYGAGDIVSAWVMSTCGLALGTDAWCNGVTSFGTTTVAPKSTGTDNAYVSPTGYQIPKSADGADPATELGEL